MECVVLDIMGFLLLSGEGNRYLFVIEDYFIKWIEVVILLD